VVIALTILVPGMPNMPAFIELAAARGAHRARFRRRSSCRCRSSSARSRRSACCCTPGLFGVSFRTGAPDVAHLGGALLVVVAVAGLAAAALALPRGRIGDHYGDWDTVARWPR
jgi:hypothetical protein